MHWQTVKRENDVTRGVEEDGTNTNFPTCAVDRARANLVVSARLTAENSIFTVICNAYDRNLDRFLYITISVESIFLGS